jgi:antitoxin ParD1/3/4
MNISLPARLKRFVDDRVASGLYGSASEFVREAIREKMLREQDREGIDAALAAAVVEGLESGPAINVPDDFVERKRRALLERSGRSDPA